MTCPTVNRECVGSKCMAWIALAEYGGKSCGACGLVPDTKGRTIIPDPALSPPGGPSPRPTT